MKENWGRCSGCGLVSDYAADYGKCEGCMDKAGETILRLRSEKAELQRQMETTEGVLKANIRTLELQISELRETNTRLNRRCQDAESAASVKVEEIHKQGGSFGRALAAWSAGDQRRKAEEAEAKLKESNRLNGVLQKKLAEIRELAAADGLGDGSNVLSIIYRDDTEKRKCVCAVKFDTTPSGNCFGCGDPK